MFENNTKIIVMDPWLIPRPNTVELLMFPVQRGSSEGCCPARQARPYRKKWERAPMVQSSGWLRLGGASQGTASPLAQAAAATALKPGKEQQVMGRPSIFNYLCIVRSTCSKSDILLTVNRICNSDVFGISAAKKEYAITLNVSIFEIQMSKSHKRYTYTHARPPVKRYTFHRSINGRVRDRSLVSGKWMKSTYKSGIYFRRTTIETLKWNETRARTMIQKRSTATMTMAISDLSEALVLDRVDWLSLSAQAVFI